MKKVRIMLAAIVVLGSVGGALAFKAKTFGQDTYCTTTTVGKTIGDVCPVLLQEAKFVPPAPGAFLYRKVATPNCTNVICTSIGLAAE